MNIRRAVPADGPAYLDLVRALAEFEKLEPPDQAARQRLIDDAFSDPPRYELWVAELESGHIVGYAVTFMTYSTFLARPSLYLEDLFVHPDARRRGIGTKFMDTFKELAKSRGCGRLEWSVLEWNRGAKALYLQMGAELMADWQMMRMVL